MNDNTIFHIIRDFKPPVISKDNAFHILTIASSIKSTQNTDIAIDWMHRLSILDPGQQDMFFELISSAMDFMVNYIRNSDEYEKLNRADLQEIFPLRQTNIPTGNIYSINNIGKKFISIDLKNAAFQALRYWNNQFIKMAPTYRQYIESIITEFINTIEEPDKYSFINHVDIKTMLIDYLSDSKSIRQVIFGNTNPKRIQHIEKYMIQSASELIQKISGLAPVRANNDELIYEYDDSLIEAIDQIGYISDNMHVEIFELHAYHMLQKTPNFTYKGSPIFVKESADGYKFKCLPVRIAYAFELLYRIAKGMYDTEDNIYYKYTQYLNDFLSIPVLDNGYANYINKLGTEWSIEEISK